jgi:hypothetical protein
MRRPTSRVSDQINAIRSIDAPETTSTFPSSNRPSWTVGSPFMLQRLYDYTTTSIRLLAPNIAPMAASKFTKRGEKWVGPSVQGNGKPFHEVSRGPEDANPSFCDRPLAWNVEQGTERGRRLFPSPYQANCNAGMTIDPLVLASSGVAAGGTILTEQVGGEGA